MPKQPIRWVPPVIQSEIPVFLYNTDEAQEAFLAYAALVKAEKLHPSLSTNEGFAALKSATHAEFLAKFEAM
jgi:hypothetical protein